MTTSNPPLRFDARAASLIPGTHVGVLGGGQLARMLVEAAHRLGLAPAVYAESPSEPALALCRDATLGTVAESDKLRSFLERVDVVAFENEFVPCEALEAASQGLGVAFVPPLSTLAVLRDKLGQKRELARLGIPSAAYVVYAPGESIATWVARARDELGGTCVIKWACFGYDGKGTLALDRSDPIAKEVIAFCEAALARGAPLFAERKVPFVRELALTAAYATTGEFATYPLVVSRQRAGVCVEVYGPATSFDVDPTLEARAREYARLLATDLPLSGIFAVEMFELASGELWVNEIAPRVHNTTHYTLDAADTSQFENHWRALLGLPLGSTRTAPGFAMRNLLGPEGVNAPAARAPLPIVEPRAHLHWYGKRELRPGRKLGHLNGRVDAPGEVSALRAELDAIHDAWAARLQRA